ncbi:hypothetical protein AURDEDRAFT_89063 [Auricularia subglabra TFB-10046 SS5]|nr:hypothetical protein AURDEDRAFT_89063 [Auricularia subglabra TFB-10046 SS5]
MRAHAYSSYNWSPWRPDLQPSDLPFWPMLRAEDSIGDWPHVTAGYATTAMGCNEVNQAGQAQMSVERGVQIWRQYLQPLKNQGYKLVSHSTNQAPDGLDWQRAWRNQCPDCHDSVDYYAVHWYGTDATAFKDYVNNFHNVVGKPIVVTEFACQDFSGQTSCDSAKARSFMDDVTDWMNNQDYVYGYFWFGMWPSMPGGVSQANSLVNGDGTPNSLGQNYMNS